MGKIRRGGQEGIQRGRGRQNLDPAQRKQRRAARLKRIMSNGQARALVEDAEKRANLRGGKIAGDDLNDLMNRAMEQQPGSEVAAAMREAMTHVVEEHDFTQDAQPQADALKTIAQAREDGSLSKQQTVDMIQDMVDRSGGKITDKASNAIKYAAWSSGDIMDDGARLMVGNFLTAWYEDQVESGVLVEGRRQLKQQLAQDKQDFKDFMTRDKGEHKRKSLDEFKEDLQENRVDSSDWQTLMIWLQTGLKKNPITN